MTDEPQGRVIGPQDKLAIGFDMGKGDECAATVANIRSDGVIEVLDILTGQDARAAMTDELSPAQIEALKSEVMMLEIYGRLWVTAEEYAEATKPGRVIWADGPPPDELKDGRPVLLYANGARPAVMQWDGAKWTADVWYLPHQAITRHARLE